MKSNLKLCFLLIYVSIFLNNNVLLSVLVLESIH